MTSMREKIAERLVQLYTQNDGPLDGFTVADAVLDVLMEPTVGMVEVAEGMDDPGSSIFGEPYVSAPHGEAFTAMIKAAKDGK